MATIEITQEQFDRAKHLWVSAQTVGARMISDRLTLAEKVALDRQRRELLAERRRVLGVDCSLARPNVGTNEI